MSSGLAHENQERITADVAAGTEVELTRAGAILPAIACVMALGGCGDDSARGSSSGDGGGDIAGSTSNASTGATTSASGSSLPPGSLQLLGDVLPRDVTSDGTRALFEGFDTEAYLLDVETRTITFVAGMGLDWEHAAALRDSGEIAATSWCLRAGWSTRVASRSAAPPS